MRSKEILDHSLEDHLIVLRVCDIRGRTVNVSASVDDTIFQLKAIIATRIGVARAMQRLSYNKRVLRDSHRLRDYSLRNGSCLMLVVNIRGQFEVDPIQMLIWVIALVFASPIALCLYRYYSPCAPEKYKIEHQKWKEAVKRRKESKKASRKASKELAEQRKARRKASRDSGGSFA